MKRLAAALLATTCLTAPTAARAEPISISIASAIGVTLVAGTTEAAIATAALYLAAAVTVSLVSSALLRKGDAQATDTSSGGADLSVQYGAAIARSAIMGPGAVGGHHVYTNVYGPTNEAMDCVFVIGDGQHGKLTALKYNGKDCTLPVGGLAPGVVYAVPEFIVTIGPAGSPVSTPCVGITYYDGRYDQDADASLISHSNPPGRWTTDHRGRGVAYLYVHQIYAEGDVGLTGVPQLMIETEGLRLYDPRKDSTNGGSGPHRWGLPDTYEPSANPAVQEYNFRRGVYVNGQRVLGMSMSPVNLILQMYFAAANINDEPIPLAEGGTEPRYRCSVAASDDRAASDVLTAMRGATAGWSLERGGQFGPIPGVPQIPISSLAFTDDDMIVGASASFTKYRSRSELVTATYGQFSDPAQFWVSAAFPPRENTADDAAIGERIAKSLDLTQVFSSSQAQRIAESERRRTLQQGQGTATLPAKWIGVQPGDWLTYNSARHGNMTVLVTGATLDTAKQQVTITYERTSNSVYSWTTAGELFPPDVGDPGTTGTLIMMATGMTATGVVLPGDSGLLTPGIQFAWTPILDPTVEQIDFEIRKFTGDATVLPFTAEFPAGGSAVCSGHGIAAATSYAYRHKLYTNPERGTVWSEWAAVTSGSQHIVQAAHTATTAGTADSVLAEDIIGQIVEAQIADAAVSAAKIRAAAVDATKFAAGIEPVATASSLPSPTGYTGPQTVFNTTDKKLYRYTGTGWTVAVPTVDLVGTILTPQIADGAVITAKLAAAAVTASQLASGAVDATKFASGIEPVGIVSSLPSPSGYTGPKTVFNTTDKKTYRYTGTAFVATVPTSDLTGQVITGQIADSAVSSAKIAAAAIVSSLIASGAVTADKMAIGSGANLAANSDMLGGVGNVLVETNSGVAYAFAQEAAGSPWAPAGMSAARLAHDQGAAAPSGTVSQMQFRAITANGALDDYPVDGGKWYECSAYAVVITSGLSNAHVILLWLDASGATVGAAFGNNVNGAGTANGTTPDSLGKYPRSFVIAQAPSNAVKARLYVQMSNGGDYPTYLIATGLMFAPAQPNQTVPSPWSPSGFTVIQGGQIVADSITATQIAASAITATELSAGAVTTSKIAAGAVTATQIAAHTITATQIAAGTITATEIATDTITAGQIAAGAINTSELAAGAVTATIIAAGAVTTSKLAVGTAANMITNADLLGGTSGWFISNTSGVVPSGSGLFTASPWRPFGFNSLYISYYPSGTPASGSHDVFAIQRPTAAGGFEYYPVKGSQNYEFSCYFLGRGYVQVDWYDKDGAGISSSVGNLASGNTASMNLKDWARSGLVAVAPSNAVQAALYVIAAWDGTTGASMFVAAPYFAPAAPNQTNADLSEWTPAGATVIDGARIVTDSITASQIAANAITASEIAAGAITTTKIAAGAVTANEIAANTITGNKIAANTITASNIAADTIGAGQIAASAVNTSELAANAVTAGIIAAGAITTDKLAVGSGANMLYNPDLYAGRVGHVVGYNSLGGALDTNTWGMGGGSWYPAIIPAGFIHTASGTTGQRTEIEMQLPKLGGGNGYYPVEEGRRYEFSFYCLAFGCANGHVNAVLQFFDSALSGYNEFAGTTSDISGGATLIRPDNNASTYIRLGVISGAAPANKPWVRPIIRVDWTGGGDGWVWWTCCLLAPARPNQTDYTPWSQSGATVIDGGSIVAHSITASQVTTTNLITASAQIANLIVDNFHVRNGAICVPNMATAGAVVFGPGTDTVIVSTTVTFTAPNGSSVIITGSYSGICDTPNNASVSWRMTIDGVQVAVSGMAATLTPYPTSLMGAYTKTANGASQTVTIAIRASTGTGNPTAQLNSGNLVAVAYQR